MVVAFHLQVPGASGGYLGVSVFFTLSGFLITHLLLAELEDTGEILIGPYLARRARRLLPAMLLGLAFVVVLGAAGVVGEGLDLRRQVWAALAQMANWFDLLSGNSYGDLFAAPSPVAHFWSLAIEEQFYWLWPTTLIVIERIVRRLRPHGRRPIAREVLPVVIGAFAVTALSAPVTAAVWSSDAAYLATWARAAEIFAGVLLAVLARLGLRIERAARLALPALTLLVVITLFTPAGHGWAYQGGLPAFAVVSAIVIAGLQGPSMIRTFLSARPLVRIGRISYGIYVFHWPVIVWLTRDRTGMSGPTLGLLRLAVTLALAMISYKLVERPIKRGARLSTAGGVVPVAAMGYLAVALVAVVVPARVDRLPPAPLVLTAPEAGPSPSNVASVDSATSPPEAPTDASSMGTASSVPTARAETGGSSPQSEPIPKVAEPRVVAVFGDSVPAWLLRDAAPTYDRDDVIVVNGSREACDAFDGLPVGRDRHGRLLNPPDDCEAWTVSYPSTLAAAPRRPDVAVLVLGQAPVIDHEVDGEWRHPCSGIEWYLDDVARRLDFLAQSVVPVVFALPASPGRGTDWIVPDDFEARYVCVRSALTKFLADRGVATIDLDEQLCAERACDDTRVDGVHVRPELAPPILDWLLDHSLELVGRPPG